MIRTFMEVNEIKSKQVTNEFQVLRATAHISTSLTNIPLRISVKAIYLIAFHSVRKAC